MLSAARCFVVACLIGVVPLTARAELSPTPSFTFATSAYEATFESLSAGDTNGHGYSDLVVSSRDGIRVFLGHANGLSATPDWRVVTDGTADIETAFSVAVGDVTGDGKADILAGFPLLGGKGKVYLWLGDANVDTRPD